MKESDSYITIVPPGAIISELMSARGITKVIVATALEVDLATLDQILNGDAEISEEYAERLEPVFGASATFWTTLQSTYEKMSKKA